MANADAPANLEAEQVVLGSVLIDPGAMEKLIGWLTADYFYDSRHATIYAAAGKLYDSGAVIDMITVADYLEAGGKLDAAGGIDYIGELVALMPTSIHVEHYAKIVERYAMDRIAVKIATEVVREAYSGSGKALDKILALAEEARNKMARSVDGPRFLDDVITSVVDNAQEMATLRKNNEIVDILTPWPALNDIIGSLIRGDQVVVVGEANVGKSAFVQQIVDFAALTGNHGCIVFTTETTAEAFAARQLAPLSGLWSRKIMSGDLESNDKLATDDWDKLLSAVPKAMRPGVLIDDETNDVGHVDLRLRQAKAKLAEKGIKLRLAVFDYLQMFHYDGTRTDKDDVLLKRMIYHLRHLAIKHEIATIVVSEVTAEAARGGVVNLKDAKGSGSIVFSATIGMSLNRTADGLVTVSIQKMKDGRRGEVTLPAMSSGAAWFGKPL